MITFTVLCIIAYLVYVQAKKHSKPNKVEKPTDLQAFSLAMTGTTYHFQYDNGNRSCFLCQLINKDCPLSINKKYQCHCKESLGSFLDILE